MRRSPPRIASYPRAAPRLACVRPVASVHPEPGSNSSLYSIFGCPQGDFHSSLLCNALSSASASPSPGIHHLPESLIFLYYLASPLFNREADGSLFLSCTSLLYYFSCLCKSLNAQAPFGAQTPAELSRGASLPVCGCKGTPTLRYTQEHTGLSCTNTRTFFRPHYILYARARELRG